MTADDLTPRQRAALVAINRHRRVEQCNPTRRELADALGLSSENAADELLRRMARHGVLRMRDGAKARGYVVTQSFVEVLE